MLVNIGGGLTRAGRAYQELTGAELESYSFDPAQTPMRRGNVESIRMRGGKERVVRSYDPATSEYSYTSLGKRFFKDTRREYIVKVPAKFEGVRSNGRRYERMGYFPVHDPVSVRLTWNRVQRDAYIKMVLVNRFTADNVIAEFSEEKISYRPHGQWLITEMTTTPDALAHPEISERRLGVYPGSLSTIPNPEAICASAFEDRDDKLCCIRQLSEVTKTSVEEVSDLMDACERTIYGTDSTWREEGCTSKMIMEYARVTGRGACMLHVDRVIEVLPGKNALCYCIVDHHAYFYLDPRVRRQLVNRKVATTSEKIRRDAKESTTPEASEWGAWTGAFKPGHYYVDEEGIETVRGEFLSKNRHPKLLMKDESRIKALKYTFTRAEEECGTCTIHAMPSDANDIMRWLEKLDCGIKYRGEGLPGITYKVLVKLAKQRERRYLEGEEKHSLMEESFGYVCALCGERGARLEWDHIQRFSQSFNEQEAEEFQPLCQTCHRLKTAEEPSIFDADPLASHVDRHVWDEYVMSEHPPPLVYKFKEVGEDLTGCRIADVRRCRFRALLLNVHPIPVLSPLDNIEKCDCTLGDLNFVTRRATTFQAQLGYTGPGWQHRVQTEWLLYTNVITWDDIAYTITANSHLPADILKAPLERMEAAWTESGGALGKQSVNAMIGTSSERSPWLANSL